VKKLTHERTGKLKNNSIISRRILLAGFVLANVSALIYEIAWSRMFGYIFGTSMLAVSAVLSSFMGGLALGSYFGGRIADKSKTPVTIFIYIQVLIGVYGIATLGIYDILSYPYSFLYHYFGMTKIFSISLFVLSFLFLIIPTSLIGAAFPVFNKIYVTGTKKMGQKISDVYSADTAGAAIGALLSGFILIPMIGLNKTILVAALINILIAIVIFKLEKK
jgi:spermidine synthase